VKECLWDYDGFDDERGELREGIKAKRNRQRTQEGGGGGEVGEDEEIDCRGNRRKAGQNLRLLGGTGKKKRTAKAYEPKQREG